MYLLQDYYVANINSGIQHIKSSCEKVSCSQLPECTTCIKISHLVASLPTSRQQVVFALLVPSCQQVWNKLLTICNNLVDIIRLDTRLFQRVRYSHDITILLQPFFINLVTFLFIMTVSDLLEKPCDKSDNAINLVTSC
jgi:hypothetical protein